MLIHAATDQDIHPPLFGGPQRTFGLLRGLARLNRGGGLKFFGELRAERLTAEQIALLPRAGFTDIEVLPFPVSVRGRRPGPSEKKSRLVEAGLCRVYEREA